MDLKRVETLQKSTLAIFKLVDKDKQSSVIAKFLDSCEKIWNESPEERPLVLKAVDSVEKEVLKNV